MRESSWRACRRACMWWLAYRSVAMNRHRLTRLATPHSKHQQRAERPEHGLPHQHGMIRVLRALPLHLPPPPKKNNPQPKNKPPPTRRSSSRACRSRGSTTPRP